MLVYIQMNIHNVLRIKKRRNKTALITIRITPEISEWLRKKDYSPTGIFYEAIRQLGYRERKASKYYRLRQNLKRD